MRRCYRLRLTVSDAVPHRTPPLPSSRSCSTEQHTLAEDLKRVLGIANAPAGCCQAGSRAFPAKRFTSAAVQGLVTAWSVPLPFPPSEHPVFQSTRCTTCLARHMVAYAPHLSCFLLSPLLSPILCFGGPRKRAPPSSPSGFTALAGTRGAATTDTPLPTLA